MSKCEQLNTTLSHMKVLQSKYSTNCEGIISISKQIPFQVHNRDSSLLSVLGSPVPGHLGALEDGVDGGEVLCYTSGAKRSFC